MASKIITFSLNGKETEVMVKPMTSLQKVIRDQLGLMAVKDGCGQGGCGSCTLLVNGKTILSCLLPIEEVAGCEVTTLEGITPDEGLDPIQQAFLDEYAIQCGYCSSGMILASKALLSKHSNPTREEVIQAISGNICRCTGYEPIIQAILKAGGLNENKGGQA